MLYVATEGLDPLLLPLHLPHSIDNWENAISLCGEFLNGYYKDAVKHLDLALNSNPPILVALLPLIQVKQTVFLLDDSLITFGIL